MKKLATYELLITNPEEYYKIPRLEKYSDSWTCRDSYYWAVGKEDENIRACKLDVSGNPLVDEDGYAI